MNFTKVYAIVITILLVCAGGFIYKNNTSLQTQIDNYKSENVELKTELASAKRAEANANQQFDQVSQILAVKIAEVNKLEDQLKQLDMEVQKSNSINDDLNQQIAVLLHQSHGESSDLSGIDSDNILQSIKKMLSEINDSAKKIARLESDLKTAEDLLNLNKRDLDSAKAALNNCKDAYRKYIQAMNAYIFWPKAPEEFTPPIQGPDSFYVK